MPEDRYTAMDASVETQAEEVKTEAKPEEKLVEAKEPETKEETVSTETGTKEEGEKEEGSEEKPKKKSGHQRDREKIQRLQGELEALKSLVLAPPAPKKPQDDVPPNEDDYEDARAYKEAERKWLLAQAEKIAETKTQKALELKAKQDAENQSQTAFKEKLSAVHAAHPDLEDLLADLGDEGIQTTRAMDAMIRSDAEILYQLASQPEETRRISRLPEHEQYIELGKLREKAKAKPAEPQTKASPPIKPVSGSVPVLPKKDRFTFLK